MMKLDIRLYQLLIAEPRMSYRELASRLGTSTPAIHKRVQALTAAGVLRTTTVISTNYVNATVIGVFGHIGTKLPVEEVIQKLRQNDSFSGAQLCSSNVLFVIGFLRRSTDMESFRNFVQDTCQMKESVLAIDYLNEFDKVLPSPSISSEVKLSTLDMRIIDSIHYDGRKSYGQISTEIGVSARTVRKHLERMIEEGSIEIWTIVDPSANQDFFSNMTLVTKDGVDRTALGIDLMRLFPDQVILFRTFCNLPNIINLGTIHPTMSNLYDMMNRLSEVDGLVCAVPHVILKWWWAETWRDKMVHGRDELGIWPLIEAKPSSKGRSE